MHPAEPAEVREFVGREVPVIRLSYQWVLDRHVICRGIVRWVFAGFAAPWTIAFVLTPDVFQRGGLTGQQRLHVVRVRVDRVVEICEGIMHQRIVDLPGKLLVQLPRGCKGNLKDTAGWGIGVCQVSFE